MIKHANWIWSGLSTEQKPSTKEGAFDGHIFKELDTGESYTRVAGIWVWMETGLSFIKATKSGKITTPANGIFHVTFNTPFIDNDYTVSLTCLEMCKGKIAFVDRNGCTGCDVCVEDCPEVFKLDDDNIAVVLIQPVPSNLQNTLQQAVDDCPVQAISTDNMPLCIAYKDNVTKDGFDIHTRCNNGDDGYIGFITVSWLATRDYNP